MAYLACCNQYITSTTSTTLYSQSTNTAWITWVNSGTNQMATNIWPRWVNNTTANTSTCNNTQNIVYHISEEERAANAAAADKRNKEYIEATKKREEANAQAMALLRENLSEIQCKALDKNGWFLVEGGKSKKTYRINGTGYAGNIIELDGDKDVARLCVHADSSIPLGDQLLAQAMSLQWDEDHIISKANKTRLMA